MKTAISQAAAHHVRLGALIEQEPDANNRVSLDKKERDHYGVPLPHIAYRLSDYVKQGLVQAKLAHTDIFTRMDASQLNHAPAYFGAGHIMGTTKMGADAKTSVVDSSLRSHDHHNLFVVGASVFPTGGTANPTLTIAALSLRAVDAIAHSLR